MRVRPVCLPVLLAALLGAEAAAAPLAVPPGMAVVADTIRDPDSYALPLRPAGDADGATETVAGRVHRQAMRGPSPETPLGAVEAVAAPLAAMGFETVFDCPTRACGGFDFMLAVEVLPQPAMLLNPGDFHQRTLRRAGEDGSATHVSLLASRFAGSTHLQAVTVVEAVEPAAPPAVAAADAPDAAPPEPAAALSPDPAERLAETLLREGRVVLEGLDFAPAAAGGDAMAYPVLDHAAAMLRARPDLSVAVVGHSDGVGGLDVNLRVSRQRAESVMAALVARGVAPDRLDAAGAAWLAPRASNATESGRAANRRVELVLR